jgi:hypothetical protein
MFTLLTAIIIASVFTGMVLGGIDSLLRRGSLSAADSLAPIGLYLAILIDGYLFASFSPPFGYCLASVSVCFISALSAVGALLVGFSVVLFFPFRERV